MFGWHTFASCVFFFGVYIGVWVVPVQHHPRGVGQPENIDSTYVDDDLRHMFYSETCVPYGSTGAQCVYIFSVTVRGNCIASACNTPARARYPHTSYYGTP
jgi:hypothetical protein